MTHFDEKGLVWAPVSTTQAVEEAAAAQLIQASRFYDRGPTTGHAEAALTLALKGQTNCFLKLVDVATVFTNAINNAGDSGHYSHVTGPLYKQNDINCAIRANKAFQAWKEGYPKDASPERKEVEATLKLHELLTFERNQARSELRRSLAAGVEAWSTEVKECLRAQRIAALSAIQVFTPTDLRKTLSLFNDPCDNADLEFMAALLAHRACDKHPKYSFKDAGRRSTPFRMMVNGLYHAIVSYSYPWAGSKLLFRILERFDRAWDNQKLLFSDGWEFNVHSYNFFTLYGSKLGYNLSSFHDRFNENREVKLLEGIIMSGNTGALEALFKSPAVDTRALLNVINLRLATHISQETYDPHNFSYDIFPLSEIPPAMLTYLLSPQLYKPWALRLPSMHIEPPEVTDVPTEEELQAQQDPLAEWGWSLAPQELTMHQRRRQRWDALAAHEHRAWVRVRGWKLVREAHRLRYIANWWSETALGPRYAAEPDAEGRPLMLGEVAAGDQTALGEASAEGANGMSALDKAAIKDAARVALPSRCLHESEGDRQKARKMAALERDLIAAREQRLRVTAEAKEAAKVAAAKVAAAKVANGQSSFKKRKHEQ